MSYSKQGLCNYVQVDAAVQVCVYENDVLLAPPSTCMLFSSGDIIRYIMFLQEKIYIYVLQSAGGRMHCFVQVNSERQLVHWSGGYFFMYCLLLISGA